MSSKTTKTTNKATNKTKLAAVSKMLDENKKNGADKQKAIYTGMYDMQVIRN